MLASPEEWCRGDVRHSIAAHSLCGGKKVLLAIGGPVEL